MRDIALPCADNHQIPIWLNIFDDHRDAILNFAFILVVSLSAKLII